jgi:hypothetical protein
MTPPAALQQLHLLHVGKVSDKWSSYLERYDHLLRTFRTQPIHLLEIGIQNGGSLEIWAKYFPHAQKIIGCDIDDACATLTFSEPNIHVIVGDAKDNSTREKIVTHSAAYDIIIDDGSHHSHDIVQTFLSYFSLLKNDGLYIIEDLHCSYWSSHAGGVHHPQSSIQFLKLLIDLANQEHWREAISAQQLLKRFTASPATWMSEISGITFYNSICVIEKKSQAINKLGLRCITGTQATVRPEIMPQNEQTCAEMHNTPTEIGYPSPEDIIKNLDSKVEKLNSELDATQASLNRITTSRYWKFRLFIINLLMRTQSLLK